ncbi:fibronectin type III domain-containing protein [Spirochaetia bacterium 38H-sp]|uniref:Fibronectin type III domain-containing protein n=1 Tax=Rarispira pelagica TaxID=3141764 RepID=A0ABU9UAS8_9SPIR
MKIRKILIYIPLLCLFIIYPCFAEEIIIGKGTYDWEKILQTQNNASIITTTIRGQEKTLGISISTKKKPDNFTDMLLSFENSATDIVGNFIAVNIPEIRKINSPEGQNSISLETNSNLILKPVHSKLFYPGAEWQEAEISFWIKTIPFQEEAGIFLWKGVLEIYNKTIPQTIECSIRNQKISWRFINTFFSSQEETSINIIDIESQSRILPDKWYKITLLYQADPGILTLKINNKEEAIIHTTASGKEGSIPYFFKLGQISKNLIYIGHGFTGYMDNIVFSTKTDETTVTDKNLMAYIETKPLEIEKENVIIENISYLADIPQYANISIDYRTSKKAMEINQEEWQPISFFPLQKGKEARFIQLRIKLDAIDRDKLPLIKDITIKYKNIPPLLPPARISAKEVKNGIELHWSQVKQKGIGGYRIYFGTRSGYYFGSDNTGKDSPIETQDTYYTIKNLEPGKIYFFSITTFSKDDKERESKFSAEISARAGSF